MRDDVMTLFIKINYEKGSADLRFKGVLSPRTLSTDELLMN